MSTQWYFKMSIPLYIFKPPNYFKLPLPPCSFGRSLFSTKLKEITNLCTRTEKRKGGELAQPSITSIGG